MKAHKSLGDVSVAKGRHEEAKAHYTAALLCDASNDEQAVVWCNRALCHLRTGDAEASLQDAEAAMLARPTWAKAHLRAATAHLTLKQFDAAFFYVQCAISLTDSLKEDVATKAILQTAREDCPDHDPMPDELVKATNAWAHTVFDLDPRVNLQAKGSVAGAGLVANNYLQAGSAVLSVPMEAALPGGEDDHGNPPFLMLLLRLSRLLYGTSSQLAAHQHRSSSLPSTLAPPLQTIRTKPNPNPNPHGDCARRMRPNLNPNPSPNPNPAAACDVH